MTPQEFVKKLPEMYPYTGDPEFSFTTRRDGPPTAWKIFRKDEKWYAETRQVGLYGGAYTPAEEIDLPQVVQKYWADITATWIKNGHTLWPKAKRAEDFLNRLRQDSTF